MQTKGRSSAIITSDGTAEGIPTTWPGSGSSEAHILAVADAFDALTPLDAGRRNA